MNMSHFIIADGEKPLDIIKPDCGFLSIFRDVGVIGDSLSSGEFESTGDNREVHYHDMYEYSWPNVLGRITGAQWHNYSRGGMTAKEFMNGWADEHGYWEKRQAYIIELGNNDLFVFGQQPGSALDVNPQNPSENPDTFFGWLGKVISKCKALEPDSRIFLVGLLKDKTGPEKDAVVLKVTEEMKKVASMFSYTYVLDMATYGIVYDEATRSKFAMGYHPNAMGYYAFALMVGNYIDYIIRSDFESFKEVPFIGKGLSNAEVKPSRGR